MKIPFRPKCRKILLDWWWLAHGDDGDGLHLIEYEQGGPSVIGYRLLEPLG
jgi:hypothetical protein